MMLRSAIISLTNITRLVFVMESKCAYFTVRTGFVYNTLTQTNIMLKIFK